jgi:hypothetical protein
MRFGRDYIPYFRVCIELRQRWTQSITSRAPAALDPDRSLVFAVDAGKQVALALVTDHHGSWLLAQLRKAMNRFRGNWCHTAVATMCKPGAPAGPVNP